MKKRFFSVLLALSVILSIVPSAFAATKYFDTVSVAVNIMEETDISRANEKLSIYVKSGTTGYSNSSFSIYGIHWYVALTDIEEGNTADDYVYDEVNSVYLREMSETDLFEKGTNYALRFSARTTYTDTQFSIASDENITVNNNPLNEEGYNGTYSVEDFIIGNTTLTNSVITVYTLLPGSIVKDREYDVYVAGTLITKLNKDDVFGDGRVQYRPASENGCAKLFLNGINKAMQYSTVQISAEENLELVISGTNTLKSTYTSAFTVDTYGIKVNGDLTITGDGSLWVNARASSYRCAGITCTGNLYIGDNVRVSSTAIKGSTYTYGINAAGDVTIADNAVVRVYTGCEPATANSAYGLKGNNISILGNADVYVENGQACKNANYGVYASQNFNFSGKKLHSNRYGSSGSAIYSSSKTFGNVVCFGSNDSLSIVYGGVEIPTSDFSKYSYLRLEKAYDTAVNGNKITESNKNDVLGDGTVVYTPADENSTATLTLNGASLSKIKATENLIIDVVSESSVDVGSSTSDNAIDINGKCYIKGDGYLTVKGGKNSGYGIKTTGYLNFGIELTIDAKQAIYSNYTPKNSDDVYVNTVYGDADNAYDWDRETPITTYSHVYIYASAPSLYVNGVLVTDENKNAYYETEHWYAKTYGINSNDVVLYLEGVSFDTDSNVRSDSSTVWCDGDLTIELKGENSIVSPGNPSANFVAPVNCYGNLTINGNSQNEDILNISSTLSSAPVFMNSYAIQVSDELTLNNCKVTAYAPNCNSSRSYGVYAVNALNVNHSYIEGLARKHTYAENEASVGIYAGSLTINGNDCTVSGRSTGSDSGYGILVPYQFDDLELTGGNFIAIGNTAAYDISGYELNIDNYIEPIIYAKKSTGDSVAIWDGSYSLSESKYLSISQGKYNVYVGGVEVTPFNASDIFGDETAVLTFDENKLPVLTLTNANITGFAKTQSALYYACIWSEKPLTVIFNGNCTVDSGEGEINSVAEKRRYAIYNRDGNITIIANENSVTNLTGYCSIYSGADINISLLKNAEFNVNGLINSGSCISCNNFSLCGDGGYTFNVLNPGVGSCISVLQTGTTSFTSDSTEVFSNVNLRHNCPNGSENASPVLATVKQIQVKNVFMKIRGFHPTTMVIPHFSNEIGNEVTDNLLITVAKDENAYFFYKWNNFTLLTENESYNFVNIEPYYDSYAFADTNGDGIINGNDYTELVNKALSNDTEFEHKTAYDMNRDTVIDVLDCVLLERTVNNL